MFPFKWVGVDSLSDESGVLSITVDGYHVQLKLNCYHDSYEIRKLIDMAHDQGKKFAFNKMADLVEDGLARACYGYREIKKTNGDCPDVDAD